MSDSNIPSEVRDFVFDYIDSVEQLEVLLLISSDDKRSWNSDELNNVIKSNVNSIEKRLSLLTSQRLIKKDENSKYYFSPENTSLVMTVSRLAQVCKSHRHKIYEIVFSPMKKSRDFADAFKIVASKNHKGDQNG